MLGSLRNYIFAYPYFHDLVWICVLDQIYDALTMQDDPPQDEPDEFGNMLDDAPTTPAEPYGGK